MSIAIVAVIIIVTGVAIWFFKRTDPNRGVIQKDNPGNIGEGAENSRSNQRNSESHGDVQVPGTLPNSSYRRAHKNQKESFSAKDSQPASTSKDDRYQYIHRDQTQSGNSKRSPTFKTFDELGQSWLGQEYDDTRVSPQNPRTLPTSGYQRAQGRLKSSNTNWSIPTQKVSPSLPWEYDSQRDSGSAFYPLDPARYVLGKSNNPNYRSKRYARTRVVFWK